MPKPIKTPDTLFDRTWRPGHPYRPRLSFRRRLVMIVLFLVLCALIGAYQYFTNANRVRQQAEQYLAKITGGYVTVRQASLSIFEGLRLEDVSVYVDPSRSQDSLIFNASTFSIEYSSAALLQGRVEATRIVAIDPRVRLVEDVKTHQWNYTKLSPQKSPEHPSKVPAALPDVSLRNAMVEYYDSDNPQKKIGSISIDGQLSADPQREAYRFKLQSRGGTHATGPHAEGTIPIGPGQAHIILYDLNFDRDRVMLLAQVQDWWREHGLSGDVKKTELWIDPSNPHEFKANIALDNVGMVVQPEELLSRDERQCRIWARQAFDVMRDAGLDQHGFVSELSQTMQASPISLKKVDGDFTFTPDGLDINDLEATVEENRFAIKGHYAGYSDDAAASLALTNAPNREVTIPPKPGYINSLPAEVREAYTRFRPQGTCTVSVQYVRPEPGARPQVTCEVNVLDGSFVFERFPYPIYKAKGRISVDRDASSGEEHLRIDNIHGQGIPGGPNEKALISIDGEMGPFTPAIDVKVTVAGKNVSSEPALTAAFPPRTRQALRYFDPDGKGEFPQFRGDFTCDIRRLPEVTSHWNVETFIHLTDAAGSLVAFPYPMDHVTGELLIGEDHMTIKEARFHRGDADLLVKGRVDWASDEQREKNPTTSPTLRPSLTIAAHNVPIDEALLKALPPMHSEWLKRLNAQGRFDLAGKLNSASARGLDFDFDVALHDCSILNAGDGKAITGLGGTVKLTPTTLTLVDLRGKRGEADVTAHGQVSWPANTPQMAIVAEAKNLALDQTLFDMLPDSARRGWIAVHPEGSVDAKITFSGVPTEGAVASAVDVGPSTQPNQSFELVLTPHNLSITPSPVPYRLDGLTGTVTINPTTIKMQDVAGHHGSAQVRFSGTGTMDPDGPWDLELHGAKMLVDDDLKKAIPSALQSVLQSMQLQGQIAFDFSKLRIWSESIASTAPSAEHKNDGSNTNVDFAVKLNLADSTLNPGVALSKVNGSADFNGAVQQGKLADLTGRFDVPSLEISGRPATNLRADLKKRQDQNAMKLANIQAALVGGQLAGQIDWTYPDTGPSRYAMALVLRNADIKTLAGETMPDAQGSLSASLSMEGNFNDPGTRRGGGDVAISGQQLYRFPLILGLLQITSLSLPITSPFDEGTCKYSIDGARVTFETIELRAKEMMISGNGHLDFDTGRVGMSFTSKSTTNWLKVPVVNDLLQSARNELLTIHVRGTIKEPQVSGSSMNTLMTTVDEIFKGGNPPPDLPPLKKRPPAKQK